MMKRSALYLAAGGAIAAASGLSVIAAAFAVFALLQPLTGAAGAYAIIALIAALGAIVGAYMLTRQSVKTDPIVASQGAGSFNLVEIIKSRPGAAVGLSLALGLLASKNPRFAMEMVSFAKQLTQPPRP